MEILIVGLIIVALMVYASTRIKRTAAAAFDAETIETGEFTIAKPDGFLHNLNGDPKFAFEAYSKELGIAATDVRAGRVTLAVRPGASAEDLVREITASDGEIVDDISEVVGAHHYRVVETRRTEKTVECIVTYKLAERDGKAYRLEAIRLAETSEEFAGTMDAFVASFELK